MLMEKFRGGFTTKPSPKDIHAGCMDLRSEHTCGSQAVSFGNGSVCFCVVLCPRARTKSVPI